MSDNPVVLVLLATYNGARWLEVQLDTILGQTGVAVDLIVSDDGSTDATLEIIHRRAAQDPRITLLPARPGAGYAAANFYSLLRQVDTDRHRLVALADQDDIWAPDKLRRHAGLLDTLGVDAVSSDVIAFWPDGRKRLVCKSKPQREWDFLFEPPGPGCSFLMRGTTVAAVQTALADLDSAGIEPLRAHDWLIYLVARCSGLKWHISDRPSLDYRQHDANEVGVNSGSKAMLNRLQAMRRGLYRQKVEHAARIALTVMRRNGHPRREITLSSFDILREGRRDRIEAAVAAAFFLGGIHIEDPLSGHDA